MQRVSPYHAGRVVGKFKAPNLSFDPRRPKNSLAFSELVDALDALSSATTKELQVEILHLLFDRTIEAAEKGKEALEVYLLLKMLMPRADHESVYGMKTARFLRILGAGLAKSGKHEVPAQIKKWLSAPQPQTTGDPNKKTRGIICLPEVIAASHCCKVLPPPPSSSSSLLLPNQQQRKELVVAAVVTLQDIAGLCQMLTTEYLTMGSNLPGAEVSQIESLKEVFGYLNFKEWMLLSKIILKSLPVGVGPMSVLSNIFPNGKYFFSKHRDLFVTAEYAMLKREGKVDVGSDVPLACGVPFVPMTCDQMRSPYLFRWLFSKEDALNKPIPPVDGRLIILSNGKWCVPVNGARKLFFVDILSDHALEVKSRRRHVLLLREFMRSGLIDGTRAGGVIIHYILSLEKNNVIVMLLKALSDAATLGAKMVDEGDCIDLCEDDITKEAVAENILKSIAKNSGGDDATTPTVLSGKNRLKVSVCFVTKARKKKLPPSAAAAATTTTTTTSSSSSVNPFSFGDGGIASRLRSAIKTSVAKNDKKDVISSSSSSSSSSGGSVIVQQKYDGDRIQIHLDKKKDSVSGVESVVASLFTKWGKDVTEMYSNVRDELQAQSFTSLIDHVPCILDGELIVVDIAGNPLPWSSEKWRYNKDNKDNKDNKNKKETLSEIIMSASSSSSASYDDSAVVTLICENERENNHDDYFDDTLTFATVKGLKNWSGMGPTDKSQMYGRVIVGAKLRVIVYDILMHRGIIVHTMPCRSRLRILQSELRSVFLKLAHVRVIENSRDVKKMSEIISLMKEVVKNGEEGLIVKDEDKEYVFGKGKAAYKIKLSGPDINTRVIGIGFSLSSNPRLCGILTAIEFEKPTTTTAIEEEEEEERAFMISYCRTESLEGDQIWKAHEHIFSLPSKVNLVELENAMKSDRGVELEKFIVKMTSIPGKSENQKLLRRVEWKARSAEYAHLDCNIVLIKRMCADIQWLCNPNECCFGLSIKGDLRPITSDEYGTQIIPTPRHPVGRIEFVGHQISKCDTNKTVQKKFDDAQVEQTCVEEHAFRMITRMRALPPTKANLETIHKIVMTLQDLEQQQEVEWPKPPPFKFFTPDGFSLMLEEVSKKWENQQSALYALRRLSPEERIVVVGLPTYSQWKNINLMATTTTTSPPPQDAEDAVTDASQKLNAAEYYNRYKEFKRFIKRPVLPTATPPPLTTTPPLDMFSVSTTLFADYDNEEEGENNNDDDDGGGGGGMNDDYKNNSEYDYIFDTTMPYGGDT